MSKIKRLIEVNRRKNLIRDLFENQVQFDEVTFMAGYTPDPEVYDSEENKDCEIDSSFIYEDRYLMYKNYLYTGIENIFNETSWRHGYNFIFEKFKSAIYRIEDFRNKRVLFSFYYQGRYWRLSIEFDRLIRCMDRIFELISYKEIIFILESDIRKTIGIYLSEYFVELRCSEVNLRVS